MFELRGRTSRRLAEKCKLYGEFHIDRELGAEVHFVANAFSDEVCDLENITLRIYQIGLTNAFQDTAVSFNPMREYVVLRDNAPLRRSTVRACIEYGLAQIPKVFPHAQLPEGYPTKAA